MERLNLRIEGEPRNLADGYVQFTLRASRGKQELGLFASRFHHKELMAWHPHGFSESQRYRVIAEVLAEQIRMSDDLDGPYAQYQQETRIIPVTIDSVRAHVTDLKSIGSYVDGVEV
jgi:hypothetical protein